MLHGRHTAEQSRERRLLQQYYTIQTQSVSPASNDDDDDGEIPLQTFSSSFGEAFLPPSSSSSAHSSYWCRDEKRRMRMGQMRIIVHQPRLSRSHTLLLLLLLQLSYRPHPVQCSTRCRRCLRQTLPLLAFLFPLTRLLHLFEWPEEAASVLQNLVSSNLKWFGGKKC